MRRESTFLPVMRSVRLLRLGSLVQCHCHRTFEPRELDPAEAHLRTAKRNTISREAHVQSNLPARPQPTEVIFWQPLRSTAVFQGKKSKLFGMQGRTSIGR